MTVLSALPSECLFNVLDYLLLSELCKIEGLNKFFQDFMKINQQVIFFQSYLYQHYFSSYRDLSSSLMIQHLKITSINEPRKFLRAVAEVQAYYSARDLLSSIISVSSVDRAPESPDNILKGPSRCLTMIPAINKNPHEITERELHQAYYAQIVLCGCAQSSPCYWGSAPSPKAEGIEFLTFRLSSPVSLIQSFSVTPYQAFWHPQCPCYGPQFVAIQFLLPSNTATKDYSGNYLMCKMNAERLLQGFRNRDGDISKKVYYMSPFYPMNNKATVHKFQLPEPVLCIGGIVRFIFSGMHQRQTIEIGEELHDDHYLCISHVSVDGFALDGCMLENVTGESVGILFRANNGSCSRKVDGNIESDEDEEEDGGLFSRKGRIGKLFNKIFS